MKLTETMIEAFFRNELNAHQHELVKEYFRQNPEVLQKYLTETSWEEFHPKEDVPMPIADKMLSVIEAATYEKKKLRRIYYRWASVAAVLLVTGIGYHLLTGKAPDTHPVSITQRPLDGPAPAWKEESNPTESTINITLKDSSRVQLAAGARIRYSDPFAPDKRDIWLTGSALFSVGKETARPFTVYAGDLHITALGTVFKVVMAGEDNKPTQVHLLSGKVVVRPDSLLVRKGIKEIYLEPGQLLQLDKQKYTMAVSRFGGNRDPQKLAIPSLKKIFTFDNEPLVNVFTRLGADYRIRFVYKQELLKDMTFTGQFNNQKETLENFLGLIATLNNLTIRQKKNSIYISQ